MALGHGAGAAEALSFDLGAEGRLDRVLRLVVRPIHATPRRAAPRNRTRGTHAACACTGVLVSGCLQSKSVEYAKQAEPSRELSALIDAQLSQAAAAAAPPVRACARACACVRVCVRVCVLARAHTHT